MIISDISFIKYLKSSAARHIFSTGDAAFFIPHHYLSDVAHVGDGTFSQPGEISPGHNGVLFLDELPEFKRTVLEVMRQPFEDRVITISGAKSTVDYPASLMVVYLMTILTLTSSSMV